MSYLLTTALMALSVATGTLTISTGAVGTTFTVSGLSFQPKAIVFHWSGRAAAGQAEADSKFGMGIATGTASRRAYTSQSDHGNTTATTDAARYNDCCVATLTIAGAIDGKADLDAITSDGFRLIVDDQFAAALIIGYIAYGGTDLTSAEIVDFSMPGATGNQDVATSVALNTGADDKAVLFLGPVDSAFGTPTTWSGFMVGAAAGDTPANAVMMGVSPDGLGTSNTYSYCRSGECLAASGTADSVAARASVTTWLSTGFRLNWAAISPLTTFNFSALVLKGGRWQVGDALTSTGTTNQTEATTYTPKGLIVASHNKAASSAGTTQPQDERSVGFATGPADRNYSSIIDKDASAVADIGVAFNTNAMYGNQSTATTAAIEGLMDLVSFDATPGFTFVMDDADPVASFFWYLLAADAPGGGAALMAASVTGSATATAALTTAIRMAASATGAATVTAPLTTALRLAAQATGTASATAPLSTAIRFAASATGAATVTAPLTTSIALAGSAVGTATVLAPLSTSITLAGSATGIATSTAGLTASAGLAATATAVATTLAALNTSIRMVASATGAATTTAALTTAIRLAAQATAVVTGTASLAGNAASFAASVIGTATATAPLSTAITLSALASGGVVSAAALTTSIRLAASALGSATATAALTAGIQVVLTGVLRVVPVMSAALRLAPTSTGSLSVRAILMGTVAVEPTSSGRLTVSGPLTGAVRIIPD